MTVLLAILNVAELNFNQDLVLDVAYFYAVRGRESANQQTYNMFLKSFWMYCVGCKFLEATNTVHNGAGQRNGMEILQL